MSSKKISKEKKTQTEALPRHLQPATDFEKDVLPEVDRTGKMFLWHMADSGELMQEARALACEMFRRYQNKFSPRAIASWAVKRAKWGFTAAGGRQEHELMAYARMAKHGYKREPFTACMRNGPAVSGSTEESDLRLDLADLTSALNPPEQLFVCALANGETIQAAAKQAGIPRRSAFRLRDRLRNKWQHYLA